MQRKTENSTQSARGKVTAAAVLAAIGCAGLLSACSSAEDAQPTDAETSRTATPEASSPATPTPSTDGPEAAGMASEKKAPESEQQQPRSGRFAGSEPMDVFPTRGTEFDITGARTGNHEGFDRFVVELNSVAGSGKPGWRVEVTEDPRGAASGLPESYEGQTAVVVTVRGIRFPGGADGSGGAPAVQRAASERLIRSVEDQSWWEGDQRYLIGVGAKDPQVTVNYLQDPPRVVVDIAG